MEYNGFNIIIPTEWIGLILRVSAVTMQRWRENFPKRRMRGATEVPTETREDLKPARGLIMGSLFSVPVWSALGLLVWFLLRR